MSTTPPSSVFAAVHLVAHRQRAVALDVRHGHDDGRVARGLDRDQVAPALPVDDVRREADDLAVDRRVDAGAGRRAHVDRAGRAAQVVLRAVLAAAADALLEPIDDAGVEAAPERRELQRRHALDRVVEDRRDARLLDRHHQDHAVEQRERLLARRAALDEARGGGGAAVGRIGGLAAAVAQRGAERDRAHHQHEAERQQPSQTAELGSGSRAPAGRRRPVRAGTMRAMRAGAAIVEAGAGTLPPSLPTASL